MFLLLVPVFCFDKLRSKCGPPGDPSAWGRLCFLHLWYTSTCWRGQRLQWHSSTNVQHFISSEVSCCKYAVIHKWSLYLNCNRLSSWSSKMTTLVFRPTMTSFVMMMRMKKETAMILEMKAMEAQSLLGSGGVMMRYVFISMSCILWVAGFFILKSALTSSGCFGKENRTTTRQTGMGSTKVI